MRHLLIRSLCILASALGIAGCGEAEVESSGSGSNSPTPVKRLKISDVVASTGFTQQVYSVVDQTGNSILHEPLLFSGGVQVAADTHILVDYAQIYILRRQTKQLQRMRVVSSMEGSSCLSVAQTGWNPTGVSYHKASRTLVVANYGANNLMVIRVDIEKGDLCPQAVISDEAIIEPEGVVISPDGLQIASANYGGQNISLYSIESGLWTRKWVTAISYPHGIDFLPNGDVIASSLERKTITQFSKDTGGPVKQFGGYGRELHMEFLHPTKVFSWNEQLIVSDARSSTIRLLDPATMTTKFALGSYGPGRFNFNMTYAGRPLDAGQLLVLSTYQQRVLIFDLNKLSVVEDIVFDAPQWSSDANLPEVPPVLDFATGEHSSVRIWGDSFEAIFGSLQSVIGGYRLMMPGYNSVFRKTFNFYQTQSYQNEGGVVLSSPSADGALVFTGETCQFALPVGVQLDSWIVGDSLVGPSSKRSFAAIFADVNARLGVLDGQRGANGVVSDDALKNAVLPEADSDEYIYRVNQTVRSLAGIGTLQALKSCEAEACSKAQVEQIVRGYLLSGSRAYGTYPLLYIDEMAYIILKSGHCLHQ